MLRSVDYNSLHDSTMFDNSLDNVVIIIPHKLLIETIWDNEHSGSGKWSMVKL